MDMKGKETKERGFAAGTGQAFNCRKKKTGLKHRRRVFFIRAPMLSFTCMTRAICLCGNPASSRVAGVAHLSCLSIAP